MSSFDEVTFESFVMPDAAVGMKFTDTLDIDQDAHLLYMGDNWAGGVDVFDVAQATPRFVETIPLRGTLYGICVAKPVEKVFVGQAGSFLAVIDIAKGSESYHRVVTRIPTGGVGQTDLIDYEPVHRKMYAANRNEGFIAAIDAVENVLVAKIEGLGGGLEQPRFNPVDGYIYLAGHDDNVLYQIDPATDTLLATFDIVDACNPNGMAINPETNQAILACSNRDRAHTVIWDFATQSVAEVIEACGNGDGALYDATIDRYFFAASGFPSGPVLGVFDGKTGHHLGNVSTRRGASWVAYDQTNRTVYVPGYDAGKPALVSFTMPDPS